MPEAERMTLKERVGYSRLVKTHHLVPAPTRLVSDGQHIAYNWEYEGNADVCVMHTDGSSLTRIAQAVCCRTPSALMLHCAQMGTVRFHSYGQPTSPFFGRLRRRPKGATSHVG